MREMTAQGRALIQDLARRHDVEAGAVETLLDAIERGGGRQAQFSHPALGGMGQWSRDGMLMIGDMFDTALKAKVDRLCRDLSNAREQSELVEGPTHGGSSDWWPADLGVPSASGAQNDMRYACFPDRRRLVIDRAGTLTVYDTGDHRIAGVSQQQSGSQDLTFTSQHGPVTLHDLERVGSGLPRSDELRNDGRANRGEPKSAPDLEGFGTPAVQSPEPFQTSANVLELIKRLHELNQRGMLTNDEFAEKKKDLLSRI